MGMDQQACVPYDENETYDYKLVKEYNWVVKNKQQGSKNYEENYFFCWRDNVCYINELDTKVRLTKRKKEDPSGNSKKMVAATKAIRAVKHRALNEAELQQEEQRMKMLQAEDDDSSSEESAEESEKEEQPDEAAKKSDSSESSDDEEKPAETTKKEDSESSEEEEEEKVDEQSKKESSESEEEPEKDQ